jgi:hypothetical protein
MEMSGSFNLIRKKKNMQVQHKYLIVLGIGLLFGLSSSDNLFAQTGGNTNGNPPTKNLGNEDIDIVKDYTPVLNDAFKINIVPEGDTADFKAPVLTYSVDPKPMNSNYNLSPIKPVRIKDDAIKKLYHGFIKAGYGLENMPMLNLYYNSLRSKSFNAGVKFNHFSSSGKINDYGNPANSNNELVVFGTKYFDQFTLKGNLGYNRDVVHYYGYLDPPQLYSKSETKHLMQDINGDFSIESNNRDKDAFTYHAGVGFYTFKDNRSTNENNVNIKLGGGKNIDLGLVSLDADFDIGKYNTQNYSINRNIFRLIPRITINKNLFSVIAGANLVATKDGVSGSLRIYPHVRGSYQIIDDAFSVYGEITGDLERNSIRTFAKENPFFSDTTKVLNSNKKIGLEGGVTIKLEHDLMLIASAGYSRIGDMAFFYNKPDSIFPTTFNTFYDKVNLFAVKGSLEYKMAEKITLGTNIEFNQYGTETLDKPLYKPAVKAGINAQYVIAEKIYAKIDLFYNGETNGINSYYASDSTHAQKFESVKLKSYFDANLSVDYRYSKVLSLFVMLNNLGFTRYYNYYNYPNYRFTGMAGLSYSF